MLELVIKAKEFAEKLFTQINKIHLFLEKSSIGFFQNKFLRDKLNTNLIFTF